jgi:glycine/D-amino acid oxidase-like deaminating enzyme
MNIEFDRIILGAGIYGMYAAQKSLEKGYRVLVLEYDQEPFLRGTLINQARVHNGYHYPRSRSTAVKSRNYFERFSSDFNDSIHQSFRKVYAISKDFSWTSGDQFKKFCVDNEIPAHELNEEEFFIGGTTDGVFDTIEYSFDAKLIGQELMKRCQKYQHNFTLMTNVRIKSIEVKDDNYVIDLGDRCVQAPFVLNATYASTNQIHDMLGFEKLNIKYELCEIILCEVTDNIKDVGITVMDGPFFSLMPFGKTGLHSLTSVTFTPHKTSKSALPEFDCQKTCTTCTSKQIENCNVCPCQPKSSWEKMYHLAKKYLNPETDIFYKESLFTIKPILMTSEIDDSRPTIIRQYSQNPTFLTVFSGKINTIYDLDDVL